MKSLMKIAALTAALAVFGAAPAYADHRENHDPGSNRPEGKPAPAGKAYGWYCRAESRKRTGDGKGTPFSQCVRAMARVANGDADNPRQACAGLSKKRVAGERGTPFSQCVRGAAQLRRDLEAADDPTPGPATGLPLKAKAYGHYCRAESRKRTGDGKGTPFSQCVTAMAKVANDLVENPARACAGLSRKPAPGMKGTPFRQCVRAAAHQIRDMKREEREAGQPEPTA